MNNSLLIQLSENEKRFIFIFLLAFILLIIIFIGIGYIIVKVMKSQGQALDRHVHDPVVTKVITDEKHFKKYAKRKNGQLFLKQAWIPLIIIAIGALFLLIRAIALNDWSWSYNPFDNSKGFATLLWTWDYSEVIKKTSTGIVINWPVLTNNPHFVMEAWAAYGFVPCLLVGSIWYVIVVQGYFARLYRINKLAKQIFDKSLENYNQIRGYTDVNPQVAPVVQPQVQSQQPPLPQQNVQQNLNPLDPTNNQNYPPYNG